MPDLFPRINDGDWDALNRLVTDLNSQMMAVVTRPYPTYVGISTGAPGFQNSWVNFDGNTVPTHRCAYYYRHLGRVYLGGVIKTGASGTVAFNLPSGFQPVHQTNSPVQIVTAASGGYGLIDVRINGDVVPSNGTVAGTNVSTYCFLDGVNFPYK